jgi:hypothetical protein
VCENEVEGNRQLGETLAKALRSRLADLDAASSVKELLAGRPKELSDGIMSVELGKGGSLVFTANHPNVPKTINRQTDWARVHSIRILSIHGENEPS